jgi:multiple sugar transport system permease protein
MMVSQAAERQRGWTAARQTGSVAVRRWAGHLAVGLRYAVLALTGATMLVPFLWMVGTSLKGQGAILAVPPELFPRAPTLENYRRVAETVPLVRMFGNSLFVTTLTVAGQLLTCAMAAYAFGRMTWRGRDVLFTLYLATLMVPSQVTITPLFILMRRLGWVDTYQALILPGLTGAFGTFLLRQAMRSLPREYEEAAFLDGGNHWTVFWQVDLPMIRPALATLAVFATMASWNNFLWPLFVTNDQRLMTLPVGLSLLHGRYTSDWGMIMAGAVISVVPIVLVYLIAQRAFVNGVLQSGLK